jgi:Domain of unknown function (DUF5122) beta-propeller
MWRGTRPDGKTGVSGAGPYSELNDFALARYNADGSLDQSFGERTADRNSSSIQISKA